MRALLPDLLAAIVVHSCGRGEGGAVRCPSTFDTCWKPAGVATLHGGAGGWKDGLASGPGERRMRFDAVWVIGKGHRGVRDEGAGPGASFANAASRAHVAAAQLSFFPRRLLTTSELLGRRR